MRFFTVTVVQGQNHIVGSGAPSRVCRELVSLGGCRDNRIVSQYQAVV